jgi:hypothetical protein
LVLPTQSVYQHCSQVRDSWFCGVSSIAHNKIQFHKAIHSIYKTVKKKQSAPRTRIKTTNQQFWAMPVPCTGIAAVQPRFALSAITQRIEACRTAAIPVRGFGDDGECRGFSQRFAGQG